MNDLKIEMKAIYEKHITGIDNKEPVKALECPQCGCELINNHCNCEEEEK